jgi:uncharacterized protein YkwD/LysM repeat protein
MRKSVLTILALTLALSLEIRGPVQASAGEPGPSYSTPSELIEAVNALRVQNGLPPYQVNGILMGIAQGHAEYLVSIGTITHVDGDGLRPFQRALEAGYNVAGDLSQGGWFSENITAGGGMTAADAVQQWMGDAPHQLTMLSDTLVDIGAGVAVNGNTYYYVIDCGLSTSGQVAYTPPPQLQQTPTIVPSTPNADGSVIHVVQGGDTVLGLALAYGVPMADILALNNLTENSTIYVGQRLLIEPAFTPTPTQPTATPTSRPTVTSWPTSTRTATWTPLPPTATPSPGVPIEAAGGAVAAIAVSALVLAGLLALIGRKRP